VVTTCSSSEGIWLALGGVSWIRVQNCVYKELPLLYSLWFSNCIHTLIY